MVAAVFRTIFAQPDPATAASTWDEVRDQLAGRFPKIGPLMDQVKSEVLAFSTFPRGALVEDLVDESVGAGKQRDQAQSPRRRHISERSCRDPTRRCCPGRHARRVAVRRASLPVRGVDGVAGSQRRYSDYRRDQPWRVGTGGFDLKAHHPTGRYRADLHDKHRSVSPPAFASRQVNHLRVLQAEPNRPTEAPAGTTGREAPKYDETPTSQGHPEHPLTTGRSAVIRPTCPRWK
jgi:hypothetical protein